MKHIFGDQHFVCNGQIYSRVRLMVLNATFNNISVITWQSVLEVEETRVPEKTTDLPQVIDTLDHIIYIEYTSP